MAVTSNDLKSSIRATLPAATLGTMKNRLHKVSLRISFKCLSGAGGPGLRGRALA